MNSSCCGAIRHIHRVPLIFLELWALPLVSNHLFASARPQPASLAVSLQEHLMCNRFWQKRSWKFKNRGKIYHRGFRNWLLVLLRYVGYEYCYLSTDAARSAPPGSSFLLSSISNSEGPGMSFSAMWVITRLWPCLGSVPCLKTEN